MMARFLVEDRDTEARFDKTTPLKIPYITIMAPPRTGYGIVMNTAETLPTTPNMTYITETQINTSLLATCYGRVENPVLQVKLHAYVCTYILLLVT